MGPSLLAIALALTLTEAAPRGSKRDCGPSPLAKARTAISARRDRGPKAFGPAEIVYDAGNGPESGSYVLEMRKSRRTGKLQRVFRRIVDSWHDPGLRRSDIFAGDPNWVFRLLGDRLAGELGFEREGDTIVAPDSARLNKGIRRHNRRHRANPEAQIAVSYYLPEGSDLIPDEVYVERFAERGELPMALRSREAPHDLNFHCGTAALLPPRLVTELRQRASIIVRYVKFVKARFPELYAAESEHFERMIKNMAQEIDLITNTPIQILRLENKESVRYGTFGDIYVTSLADRLLSGRASDRHWRPRVESVKAFVAAESPPAETLLADPGEEWNYEEATRARHAYFAKGGPKPNALVRTGTEPQPLEARAREWASKLNAARERERGYYPGNASAAAAAENWSHEISGLRARLRVFGFPEP